MTERKIQPLTEEEQRRYEAQMTFRERALEAGIDDGYVLGFLTSAIGECAEVLDENRS